MARIRSDVRRRLVVTARPLNAETTTRGLGADVTHVSEFYVRNHFPTPTLDARTHRIRIGGAVNRSVNLRVKDLHALRGHDVITTMECAGNGRTGLVPLPPGEPWQLGAVSTAKWTGVPLRAVLEQVGVREDTVEILVVGADHGRTPEGPAEVHFARSLPLAKALSPDTLLALEMNGEPLPPEHGAPVRLIAPRWYGMASVKWVARIESLTEPFAGYYQVDRYVYDYPDGAAPTPVTTMRIQCLIVSPAEGDTIPRRRAVVRGKAWSGTGEVARVEVALDGGDKWQEARLRPATSPYSWKSWEFRWDDPHPGRHVLRARATEAEGNRQPEVARWNRYGYGNNAVHAVVVNAR